MYARFLTFKTMPEQRGHVESLANSMAGVMQSLPGFTGLHYLVSEDSTNYASLSLWATKENAVAAGGLLGERVLGDIEALATEPPQITVYEVYEPQSAFQAKAS